MKIYTLTLNPAYDVHASTEHFQPFHENLAQITSRETGGKGVNISRALVRGGTENTAVIVLGPDNAADFLQNLEKAGLNCLYLPMPGPGKPHPPLRPNRRDPDQLCRIPGDGGCADSGGRCHGSR